MREKLSPSLNPDGLDIQLKEIDSFSISNSKYETF